MVVVPLLARTVHAGASRGIDMLTVLSVFVLARPALGIVGALLHPPQR